MSLFSHLKRGDDKTLKLTLRDVTLSSHKTMQQSTIRDSWTTLDYNGKVSDAVEVEGPQCMADQSFL